MQDDELHKEVLEMFGEVSNPDNLPGQPTENVGVEFSSDDI